MARGWLRSATVAGAVAFLTASGMATASADDKAERIGGGATAGATAAADVVVPMPDLGIVHKTANGGFNLFRLGLSEVDPTYGSTELVRRMTTGGFSYDRSRVVPGDFADWTSGDDGTADHVIWHYAGDGVRLWVVPGGSNTTPRQVAVLRSPFVWANSQPMAGDVTGDGWDDLVVRQYRGCSAGTCIVDVYVFVSTGHGFAAPRLWSREYSASAGLGTARQMLADVDGDSVADLVTVRSSGGGYEALRRLSSGTAFGASAQLFDGSSSGLGFADTRTLAGDVTGDGMADLVTIAKSGVTGLAAWVQKSEGGAPTKWQDLITAGWSFASSRQYLADTDGDYIDDLVTVHKSSGTGFLVWRHVSDGTTLALPQLVDDLRTTGWNYASSREGIAHTIGVMTI
jgi:hypothetical protein